MNLRQWSSNCLEFMERLPDCEKSFLNIVNVLGLLWNQNEDTFCIPGGDRMCKSNKTTKRDVLHNVSKIFDPLGLLSPVPFYGKVFLQKVWVLNLPWDQPLPAELLMEWYFIVNQLAQVSEFNIPQIAGDIQNGKGFQLLIFCDTSVKAYAAVVYLRYKSAVSFQTNLLCAKMRLVPVEKNLQLKVCQFPV